MHNAIVERTKLIGAWCGVIYIAALLVGWWLVGGYFPLHRPSAGAQEVVEFYRGDLTRIRLGLLIVMWSAPVFLPFVATMADAVARFEGRNGPLTRTTTMAGYANAMLTFYPPLWWLICAFRPAQRSAELTYLLNDIAWLQFIGGVSLVVPMYITVTIVALADKSQNPVFPRWFGYQSIMTFIGLLPDQMLFFFKTGPFAWNGILGFWIPLTLFGGWFVTMFVLLRRAVLHDMREPSQALVPA